MDLSEKEVQLIEDRGVDTICPVCESWCTKELVSESFICADCESEFAITKRNQ